MYIAKFLSDKIGNISQKYDLITHEQSRNRTERKTNDGAFLEREFSL